MPWFNVDDGFAFHRKTVRAGNAALGLWVRAGSWCAQQLTDGHVPAEMVEVLGTQSQANRLVSAGLWFESEDGYQFHEWTDSGRNPSRSEVLLRRKKEAEKKARARQSKSEQSQVGSGGPPGTPGGVPGGVPEGIRSTTPLPSTPTKKKTSSSSRRLSPPREDVDQLCVLLADRIEANKLKRPDITEGWRTEARLLLDRDQRDPAQAARLIEWATNDDFWSANILSMPKFRKQYDQLLIKARREHQHRADRDRVTRQSSTDRAVAQVEMLKSNPNPAVLAQGGFGPPPGSLGLGLGGPDLKMLPGGAA